MVVTRSKRTKTDTRSSGAAACFCCRGWSEGGRGWSQCVPGRSREINSHLVSSVVPAEVGERFPDVPALAVALDKTGYMAGDQLAAALLLPGRGGEARTV